MKKQLLIPALLPLIVLLSGCLKDTPYMDVANTAPIIEFGLSPANGYNSGAIIDTNQYTNQDLDTAVALVIASPQVLNTSVTVTVALDTSLISAYNTANGTSFTMFPTNLFSLDSTTITIPAGYRVGSMPVTIHFSSFPSLGSYNYALPLVITNGDGLIISGNSSTFLWLFQRPG